MHEGPQSRLSWRSLNIAVGCIWWNELAYPWICGSNRFAAKQEDCQGGRRHPMDSNH